jgi:hypothetical protein
MNRKAKHAARGDSRQPELEFATVEIILRLVGAPKGWRGDWHCPCHPDAKPSFSAKPGREPGTTIVACGAGCSQEELLTHFRELGYRLGPMPLRTPPRKVNRPVIATTSVAWRALTPSERRIYELIHATDGTLAYTDFVENGISSSAISVGLRALQALGFLSVKRSPRRKGCRQYQRNLYQIERRWLRYEPDRVSKAAKTEALEVARSVARAARKGGEDITPDAAVKSEVGVSGLRVRVPQVSTSDSGRESYVVRSLASKAQDSARPTTFDEGHRGLLREGKAKPEATPFRHRDDPGPTSEDAYGSAPPQSASPRFNRVEGWRPLCGGLACGKAGECLYPGKCR